MGEVLYDTIIIGSGTTGTAAAVYAARKKLKTLIIAEGFGGQSTVSSSIENWVGELSISGLELFLSGRNNGRSEISLYGQRGSVTS